MPENAATIHLSTLLGKLYTHDCEAREALEHDTNRRAAYLAKMEGGLTQKQERLLVLVYQGSRDFAYLKGADEDLYRRVQTFCGEAEIELRKERAKSRGRSELQPSVWKYAEQAICKCLATKTEMFGEGWLRKCGLRLSTTDLSSRDGDDAILNELDELHRRGVTLELLRDIWRQYHKEADEMRLPKPPHGTAAEETAEDRQAIEGAAGKDDVGDTEPAGGPANMDPAGNGGAPMNGDATDHEKKSNASRAFLGPDAASINWYGRTFTFTPQQRPVIGELWDAHKKGLCGLSASHLLSIADAKRKIRLPDIFKGSPAWNTLIKRAPGSNDIYRLAKPEDQQ